MNTQARFEASAELTKTILSKLANERGGMPRRQFRRRRGWQAHSCCGHVGCPWQTSRPVRHFSSTG
jgi:hypothetical protein